jgi:predicted transcriptional regulator
MTSEILENRRSADVPFLKHQYRTPLGITYDIMQACIEAGLAGIAISRISQRANLSHSAVMYNCKRLIDAGMMRANRIKRKYIFIVTEKGINFFHELQKFQDMMREINIRY